MKKNDKYLVWRSHIRNLFDEILVNEDCRFLKTPLQLTLDIIGAAAQYAVNTKDEKMIAYFVLLSIYTFSDPTNKADYDEKRTHYYIDLLTNKANNVATNQ